MNDTSTPAAATVGVSGRKLARNAFFLLSSQIASSALSVILTAALARGLGVVEFGNYYLLMTVSTFAYVFVEWGQSAYLVRESARRREETGRLLGGALAFRIAAAVVIALAAAMIVKIVWADSRAESLALLAVVCGLPLVFSQAYVYVFRGRDRMDLDAAVSVTGKAFSVAITVPILLLGGELPAVILVQAVSGSSALLVAVLIARKLHIKAEFPGRKVLREFAVGGAPIAVFFLALAVQPFLDVIVLSKLAPPEVVGWYGAARNIMGLLFVPAQILGTAAFPELSRVSGSVPDFSRALVASSRLLLGLGALAAVGTHLFARLAVSIIYGESHFDPAITVLQVFAPVLPLFFMDMLFGTALTALGKTKEIAIIKLFSVAVSTGLAFLLIPLCQARWGNGGIGLVLAIGSTEALMLTAFFCLLPRGAVDRSVLVDSLRAAMAAGGTVAIFSALPMTKPWLAVPACIAVFTVLAFVCGLIRRGDLDQFVEIVRGKLRAPRGCVIP